MPDFLISPCTQPGGNCQKVGVVCKCITDENLFGICDDPPPAQTPAYLKFDTPSDWIAEVNNPSAREITFKAVDACVPLVRPDGNQESRCDGLLIHDTHIIFIELKDRVDRDYTRDNGWIKKGREQLTTTIKHFIANHDITQYTNIQAFVCNKQRPLAITGMNTNIQQFKNDTGLLLSNAGLLLNIDRSITIV